MPLKDLKDEGHGEKREFHAGPVVRTWCFYCHGPGSTPSQGAKIPQTSNVAKKKKKNEREDGQVANDCNRARCSSREMCKGGAPNLAVKMRSF